MRSESDLAVRVSTNNLGMILIKLDIPISVKYKLGLNISKFFIQMIYSHFLSEKVEREKLQGDVT